MKTVAIGVLFASAIFGGTDTPDSAARLNDAALRECREGRLAACLAGFADGVKVWRALGTDYRVHLSVALANLGFAQAATGDYGASIGSYEEALVLSSEVFGERSLHTAQVMNDYARSLMAVDAHDKAAKLLDEALEVAHTLVPSGPEEARSLRGLALLAAYRGDARRSEELFVRAAGIPAGKGPDGDLEGAAIQASLARLYASAREFTRADALLTRAGKVYARYLSANDPRVTLLAAQRGMQFIDEKKYGLAKEYLEGALAKLRSAGAGDTTGAAAVENSLALADVGFGETEAADALLAHALSIERAFYKTPNRAVAATLLNNALSLGKQGRYAEAIDSARDSVAMYRETIGGSHPETANALLVYSDLLNARGGGPEAKAARTRAETIIRHFASGDAGKK